MFRLRLAALPLHGREHGVQRLFAVLPFPFDVQAEHFPAMLQQGLHFQRRIDRQVAVAQTDMVAVAFQQAKAQTVEGGYRDLAGLPADAGLKPRPHFTCGGAGKGRADNFIAAGAVFHEVRHPFHQGTGLAASGSGEHQHALFVCQHGGLLFRVQFVHLSPIRVRS